jgi:outer membrane protein assembly factor BamB
MFIADMSGTVQARTPDGHLLWRVSLPGAISATPALRPDDTSLFVGTDMGWACALDADSGRTRWQKQIPTKADPRILSDLLYVPQINAVILNSWGGRYFALNADSGNEMFSWDAGLSPYAGAAAALDGAIYCLRAVAKQGVEFVRVTSAGSESVLHRVSEEKRGARRTMVAAAPMMDEQRALVYFVVNRDHGAVLHAWSTGSAEMRWEYPLPNCAQASPTLTQDGTVLVPDLAGFVHGIRPDGGKAFQYAAGCDYLLASAVSEAGGSSFIGDPTGCLHVFDERGAGKAVFEAPRSIQGRPSFDPHGNLYVPCTDHEVYVFPGAAGRSAG